MQFVSMLQTLSLNPEELKKLSIAFEDAPGAPHLSKRTGPIITIIVKRIIEAAKAGVRDSAELCALLGR